MLQSLNSYRVCQLLSTSEEDERCVCVGEGRGREPQACALRHLYSCNRLRGPVIIVCSYEDKELWENVIHLYTHLKVAVMSGRNGSGLPCRQRPHASLSVECVLGSDEGVDRGRVQRIHLFIGRIPEPHSRGQFVLPPS